MPVGVEKEQVGILHTESQAIPGRRFVPPWAAGTNDNPTGEAMGKQAKISAPRD